MNGTCGLPCLLRCGGQNWNGKFSHAQNCFGKSYDNLTPTFQGLPPHFKKCCRLIHSAFHTMILLIISFLYGACIIIAHEARLNDCLNTACMTLSTYSGCLCCDGQNWIGKLSHTQKILAKATIISHLYFRASRLTLRNFAT